MKRKVIGRRSLLHLGYRNYISGCMVIEKYTSAYFYGIVAVYKSKIVRIKMESKNILNITTREAFRKWLIQNHNKESECWMVAKKGKNPPIDCVWYLDAVEEVLCFGWIDTTHKKIDGVDMQRFTPRASRSPWSELNKERCRRLEKLGLMTDAGRAALPDMSEKGFVIDSEIYQAFQDNPDAWKNFQSFPKLYQRVRIDSIQRDKKKDREVFNKRLKKLIAQSQAGKMFGDWNDYGRLIDY